VKKFELISIIKQNFAEMPDRKQVKKYLWDNNIDVNMSTVEIMKALHKAYGQEEEGTTYYEKEIKKLLAQGCTHKEIMDKLYLSSYQLSKLKDEYGLNKKMDRKAVLEQSLDTYFAIYNYYKEKKSMEKTAEHFGIDRKTVKKRIDAVTKLKALGNKKGVSNNR
jgi:DNA invertase Pin-like site-specific DNA recombinase